MKKRFVLDTNVLLHDPHAIFKFEDNEVVLPIYVLEEVDQFKRETTERGRNARTLARLLDKEREKGPLSVGVPIGEGGALRVVVPQKRQDVTFGGHQRTADHAILQMVIDLKDAAPELSTILVTMDVNLRVRADALGVKSETYENVSVDVERLDTGVVELKVTAAEFDRFQATSVLELKDSSGLHANVSVVLSDDSPRSRSALGRYQSVRNSVVGLKLPKDGVMGIRSRNREQSMTLDLLLDDSVRLVTVMGRAGTGKTLLALAAGLQRTVLDGAYTRLLVSRPVMPMGKDLGALPGDIMEKLHPWMQPIYDNLEFLLISGAGKQRGVRSYEDLLQSGQLQVEPLTYIRGRSLPQQYVIVDEAQNLTPHEVKTIVTRCGEGSKIVLTGDPYQIDNPYVDSATNGLSVAADRLRGEPLVAHMLLSKGERSELANIAAAKL